MGVGRGSIEGEQVGGSADFRGRGGGGVEGVVRREECN